MFCNIIDYANIDSNFMISCRNMFVEAPYNEIVLYMDWRRSSTQMNRVDITKLIYNANISFLKRIYIVYGRNYVDSGNYAIYLPNTEVDILVLKYNSYLYNSSDDHNGWPFSNIFIKKVNNLYYHIPQICSYGNGGEDDSISYGIIIHVSQFNNITVKVDRYDDQNDVDDGSNAHFTGIPGIHIMNTGVDINLVDAVFNLDIPTKIMVNTYVTKFILFDNLDYPTDVYDSYIGLIQYNDTTICGINHLTVNIPAFEPYTYNEKRRNDEVVFCYSGENIFGKVCESLDIYIDFDNDINAFDYTNLANYNLSTKSIHLKNLPSSLQSQYTAACFDIVNVIE